MKAVQNNRVDVFVCLRALLPLILIWLESFTLGTPLPKAHNLIPLIGVGMGMGVYATQLENKTSESNLFWICAWYVSCIVDSLVVKSALIKSRWPVKTNAFLLNAFALPFLLIISILSNEATTIYIR